MVSTQRGVRGVCLAADAWALVSRRPVIKHPEDNPNEL